MSETTDSELLEAYVEQHSERAFAELVHRHLGLVYASAQRQLQQADLSADVTQAVFLLLARKAPTLRRGVILSGWLFHSTRFLAARAKRGELRRQLREQEAAMLNLQSASSESNLWNELSPHLDDAIASLSEADRRAVLLRFFERKNLREVGTLLGVSEEAAKKRVTRAVDKLRAILSKQGLTLPAATLGSLLLESPTQASPPGLEQDICAAVGAGSAAAPASIAALVAGGLRDWFWAGARQLSPWAAGTVALVAAVSLLVASNTKPAGTSAVADREVQPASHATAATVMVAQPRTRASTRAVSSAEARTHFYLSVVDRDNDQPIAGARVLVQFWGTKPDQSVELATDANGTLVVPVPEIPFRKFRAWLSAAGYVPVVMDWQAYEFGETPVLHTSRLARGTVLRVDVVDGQGRPVADAGVEISGPGIDMAQRENIAYHPRLSGGRSDGSGHYESDQIPPDFDTMMGGIALGVSHRDFAPETFSIRDASQLATNQVITLETGVRLAGRLVGPYGEPVANAALEDLEARFGIEARTDSAGHFEFAHIKPAAYTLAITASGYMRLEKGVLAGTNSPELTLELLEEPASNAGTSLRRPMHVIGTVTDAESQEPVPRFRVVLNERRGTDDRLLGDGADGAFDWRTELMFVNQFSLIIEAEGYEPMESDIRQTSEPEQRFVFPLNRGSGLTGWVIQPDGQPATNASIGLSAKGRFGLTLVNGGKLENHGHNVNQTSTDAHGHFRLNAMVGAEQLQIAHATGCASVPVASVTNVVIQLKPWGTIEGVVYAGGAPATNRPVNVGFSPVSDEPAGIPFDYNVTTDASGRFRFTQVQPGLHRVQRAMRFYKGRTGQVGFSHAKTVTVEPGEITRVVLGGEGVPVIGKLDLAPAQEGYDWSLDLHALTQSRPDLAPVKLDDYGGDDTAYWRAWKQRESQIAKFYLAIAPDGSFRADDVLPGSYDLEVAIKSMPEAPLTDDSWMKPRQPIGGIKLTVVVPDGTALKPFDLGTITVPITNAPPIQAGGRQTVPLNFPNRSNP